MSGTHGSYEGAHVSAVSQPIKSFVFTSKKASFVAHMASSTVSLAALESRFYTSKDCVDQVKCPGLHPIQLVTHALGVHHAVPQDHALASAKDRAIGTAVPLALLSARGDCGRLVYTRARSDARTSAYPTPCLPSPDFTPTCSISSSPILNTKAAVLSAYSMTTMEFSSTHRLPLYMETLKSWQRWRYSNISTSCLCSPNSCVCVHVTSKILPHISEETKRPRHTSSTLMHLRPR